SVAVNPARLSTPCAWAAKKCSPHPPKPNANWDGAFSPSTTRFAAPSPGSAKTATSNPLLVWVGHSCPTLAPRWSGAPALHFTLSFHCHSEPVEESAWSHPTEKQVSRLARCPARGHRAAREMT